MPRTKLSEYSTTNSSNTDIEGINIDEGCAPSGINNAIRELMVHLKEFQTGASGDAFTFAGGVLISGTANTITGNVLMSGTNTITGSTTATFAAGAVGTPSIAAHGDTNTGIFFPAADTIAFAEGGAEAMRIDSSGNVGIGTISPAYKLDVNRGASSGVAAAFGRTSGATGYVYVASDSAYFSSDSSANNAWGCIPASNVVGAWTNGTERMRIDSSGNVGIGVTPSYKLDIDNGANSAVIRLTGRTGKSVFLAQDSTGATVYQEANAPLYFGTNNAERMRIDSSGNVGIGNTNPSGSADSGADNLVIGANSGNNGITITSGTTSNGNLNFADSDSNIVGFVQYQHAGNNMNFRTNGTERMRITSDGEVYIAGTTDQGAYNLQVNGTGVWGAGAYVNGSDERIKDNIAPLDSGLDVVAKLNPVTYKYKENWSKDQSTQTGFIAQELLTALDGKNYVDGVVQQGGEYMSVAYQNIIPILTKAIQELKSELDAAKARIATLESN